MTTDITLKTYRFGPISGEVYVRVHSERRADDYCFTVWLDEDGTSRGWRNVGGFSDDDEAYQAMHKSMISALTFLNS